MTVQVNTGDCRKVLTTLAPESVHCCITSPPYFGLRDYGVPSQIGLEPSVDAYIDALVAVFREVRRVLRDDGTLWLNMGDAYYSPRFNGGVGTRSTINSRRTQAAFRDAQRARNSPNQNPGSMFAGAANRLKGLADLKPKDLIGLPWMLAFALRADGWHLRQDIIWSKPNPMPESVRDRCTKAHEYIFLLSKSERYYFDADAIAEPLAAASIERLSQPNLSNQAGSDRVPGKTNGAMKAVARKAPRFGGNKYGDDERREARTKSGNEWNGSVMRNKRSVWTLATQPFKGDHFATFPEALIKPCILAGCQEGGNVLDPFSGAGTVGLVAARLQRNAILIEINPKYAEMAKQRIHADAPLFCEVMP